MKMVDYENNKSNVNWFTIFVLVIAIFAIALTVANIIYYNRISRGNVIQKGESIAMLIINIIFGIFAIILTILALWILFSHPHTKIRTPETEVSTPQTQIKARPVVSVSQPGSMTRYISPSLSEQPPALIKTEESLIQGAQAGESL